MEISEKPEDNLTHLFDKLEISLLQYLIRYQQIHYENQILRKTIELKFTVDYQKKQKFIINAWLRHMKPKGKVDILSVFQSFNLNFHGGDFKNYEKILKNIEVGPKIHKSFN